MKRPGFTLLETLVALTVAGVVMAVGYAAFARIADQNVRAGKILDTLSRVTAARRSLVIWIKGAHVTGGAESPVFTGIDGAYRGMNDDELHFVTTSAPPFSTAAARVRLFIDRDRETRQRGLVAQFTNVANGVRQHIEIVPDATGINIRYLLRDSARYQWLAGWISSVRLPAGVELRLTFQDGDSIAPLLKLPILIPLRRP